MDEDKVTEQEAMIAIDYYYESMKLLVKYGIKTTPIVEFNELLPQQKQMYFEMGRWIIRRMSDGRRRKAKD